MVESNYEDKKEGYMEFASLALKFATLYGLPAAIKIIKTLTNDKINPERIAKLTVVKTPKEYFACLSDCVDDSDCDGVIDKLDKCPDVGAPEGGCVTEEGCPDSDCDGVADADDKCPNLGAPEGGCVTEDGCPDSDCDGVADDEDACPTDPNCK